MAFELGELARRLGGRVVGDAARVIRGVATLDEAGPDELGFLTNPRYLAAARSTRAAALLVGPRTGYTGPAALLVVDEPYLALARLLGWFNPAPARAVGLSPRAEIAPGARLGEAVAVGPFAVVEEDVELGERVTIGAGCFVGAGCRIGSGTVLMPRVVLYPGTVLGARCIVHSGAVLGADGFGFATSAGEHHKVPQLGRVVVEDDVEIGANTTIDRGTLGETTIGRGSKLDDQVMVAHGVRLGEACLVAAQSGIAGSTRVGRRAVFAGQSGAAGHLEIGDGCVVTAKTAVFADLPDGAFVAGIPAIDHRRWKRVQALVRRLPEIRAELRALAARLDRIAKRGQED